MSSSFFFKEEWDILVWNTLCISITNAWILLSALSCLQVVSYHLTSELLITPTRGWPSSPLSLRVYLTSLCSLLSNPSWGWCTCLPRWQECVIFQRGVWSCCSGPIKATDQTNLDYRCPFLPLKCLNMPSYRRWLIHMPFNKLFQSPNLYSSSSF